MKAFELQAHHIFVLIAGGFILTFFIVVALKFRAGSLDSANAQLGIALETMFSSAAQAENSALNVTFPTALAYHCSKICDCGFEIGSRKTRVGEAIFSPAEYESSRASVFSIPWGIPRANNYLYITGTDHAYYVLHADSAITGCTGPHPLSCSPADRH